MSEWKQIKQPEEPDWQEWEKEVMSSRYGRCTLRVWIASSGYWSAVAINQKGERATKSLCSETIEDAKQESLNWVTGCYAIKVN